MSEIKTFTHVNAAANPCRKVFIANFALFEVILRFNELLEVRITVIFVSKNPQEVAEFVAIQALSFLASDPERLGLFLTESGIGPQTLRTAATDPKFLAGVLDFIVRDDATVKAFADASQLTPEAVTNAGTS